jgi:tRNA(Phe) wybutosine-synthesizing methylase Tyw3
MGSLIDKRLKLEQPTLESTDTHSINATKLVIDISNANKIAIETSKTGKVTAVVAILKVFGDIPNNSLNANPGKLLNRLNRRLNSKKKGLNRSSRHHGGFREPSSNASERLIVKKIY